MQITSIACTDVGSFACSQLLKLNELWMRILRNIYLSYDQSPKHSALMKNLPVLLNAQRFKTNTVYLGLQMHCKLMLSAQNLMFWETGHCMVIASRRLVLD